jgi:hypothetical protein
MFHTRSSRNNDSSVLSKLYNVFTGKRLAILVLLSFTLYSVHLAVNYIFPGNNDNNHNIIQCNRDIPATLTESVYSAISLPNSKENNLDSYSLYEIESSLPDRASNVRIIPILFIPGHRGSYKQVSNIAISFNNAVRDKKSLGFHIYSVDFNGEASSFTSHNLYMQSYFIDAALRYIHSKYKDQDIYCIAHSNGGIAMKLALSKHEDYSADYSVPALSHLHASYIPYIRVLFTLNTAHRSQPIYFDSSMYSLYRWINWFYSSLSHSSAHNSNGEFDNFHIVSIAGGHKDTLIRSDLANLEGLMPLNQSVFVFSNAIPKLQNIELSHNEIVNCGLLSSNIATSILHIQQHHSAGNNARIHSVLNSFFIDTTADKLHFTPHHHANNNNQAIAFDDDSFDDRDVQVINSMHPGTVALSEDASSSQSVSIPSTVIKASLSQDEPLFSSALQSTHYLYEFGAQILQSNGKLPPADIEARVITFITNINSGDLAHIYLCKSINQSSCTATSIKTHLIPIPTQNAKQPKLLLQIHKAEVSHFSHIYIIFHRSALDNHSNYFFIEQSLNIKSEYSYNGFLAHSYITRSLAHILPLNIKSLRPIPLEVAAQNVNDYSSCVAAFDPILYYISLPLREQKWRYLPTPTLTNTVTYDIHLHQAASIQTQHGLLLLDPRCTYSIGIATDWNALFGLNFRLFARLIFPATIALLIIIITVQINTRKTFLKLLWSYIYYSPFLILLYTAYISIVTSIHSTINLAYSPSFWTVFTFYLMASGLLLLCERLLTVLLRLLSGIFIVIYQYFPPSFAFLFGRLLFGRFEKEAKIEREVDKDQDVEALISGGAISANSSSSNSSMNRINRAQASSPVPHQTLHRTASRSTGINIRAAFISSSVRSVGSVLVSIHDNSMMIFAVVLLLVWLWVPWLSLLLSCCLWFIHLAVQTAKSKIFTANHNDLSRFLSSSLTNVDSHSKMFLLLFLLITLFQLPIIYDNLTYQSSVTANSNRILWRIQSLAALPMLCLIFGSIRSDDTNLTKSTDNSKRINVATPMHSDVNSSFQSAFHQLSLQNHHNLMRSYINTRHRSITLLCMIILLILPLVAHSLALYRCIWLASCFCIARLIDLYRHQRLVEAATEANNHSNNLLPRSLANSFMFKI